MHRTEEQFFWDTSNFVCAGAGTGKTSWLLQLAQKVPPSKHMLFLAYNRRVAEEIKSKWNLISSSNRLAVSTWHALAFQRLSPQQKARVVPSWNPELLVATDALPSWKHKSNLRPKFLLAIKLAEASLRLGNSPDNLPEPNTWLIPSPAFDFFSIHRKQIEVLAQELLTQLNHPKMPLCHDAYLYLWLKSKPTLNADVVFLDEMQDAQPQFTHWLEQLPIPMHWVGDPAQHIYAWRFAETPAKPSHFNQVHLQHSYRLAEQPASLANLVLQWLKPHGNYIDSLVPAGPTNHLLPQKIHLFRGNLGLLDALLLLIDQPSVPSIGLEGQSGEKLWQQEIRLLKDLIQIRRGARSGIRHPWLRPFKDWNQVKEMARNSADTAVLQCMQLVDKYGWTLPRLLRKLEVSTLPTKHKYQADWLGGTVHSAKGMEYKSVHLSTDFHRLNQLDSAMKSLDTNSLAFKLLREEAHIWYVALTRASQQVTGPGLKLLESTHKQEFTN